MTTYSEEEVQRLLQEHVEKLEAAHFEEQTKEVLAQINRRLAEANGYKATIGKDVKSLVDRVDAIEKRFKAQDEAAVLRRSQRSEWFQDWWIRVGIFVTVVSQVMGGAHTIGWIK